jgi:hypothetical protein
MKFMILVKASKDLEAGAMQSTELLAAMGKFNEELAKAGVLLAGEGLHPTSKSAHVRFSGEKRRLLAVAGKIERRSHRMGQAVPKPA